MSREELQVLINQLRKQIEYCGTLLEDENLTPEERQHIQEQILRQQEELERLNKELEQLPEEYPINPPDMLADEWIMPEEEYGN